VLLPFRTSTAPQPVVFFVPIPMSDVISRTVFSTEGRDIP